MSDPRLIHEEFIAYLPSLARDLGSPLRAIILQFLHFRARVSQDGKVVMTQAEIGQRVGIPERTLRDHLKWLLDHGHLRKSRVSRSDATSVWEVTLDGNKSEQLYEFEDIRQISPDRDDAPSEEEPSHGQTGQKHVADSAGSDVADSAGSSYKNPKKAAAVTEVRTEQQPEPEQEAVAQSQPEPDEQQRDADQMPLPPEPDEMGAAIAEIESTLGGTVIEDSAPHVGQPRPFPTVAQRLLVSRFAADMQDGLAWEQSWTTAESQQQGQGEYYYDPEAHLSIYLSRCQAENRKPRADLWLRFFIEDRAKHIAVLRDAAQQRERIAESPEDREVRYNEQMPPSDWGVEGQP